MGIKSIEAEIKRHYFWSLEIVFGLLVELRFVSLDVTELRCLSGIGSGYDAPVFLLLYHGTSTRLRSGGTIVSYYGKQTILCRIIWLVTYDLCTSKNYIPLIIIF